MGILAGLGAAICGVISTVATAIGPAVSAAATFIATKLPVALEVAATCVKAISTIVTAIGTMLNIAPPGEDPAELGAKTLQEGTRPRGENELTQEYLEYLRTVPLDKEKFDKLSEEEKLGCEVVGDVLLADAIKEETNVELPGQFLLAMPKLNLDAQTIYNLIKAFSDSGIKSMGEFNNYLDGDIPNEELAVKVGGAVKEAIAVTSPSMSASDIQHEITAMRQEYKSEE